MKLKHLHFYAPDTGNAGPNTQNQQTLSTVTPTPFDEIDLDLLDDKARATIIKAKEDFATIAKQAAEAGDLKAKHEVMQGEIDKIRAQANQQPHREQTKELTLEEEIAKVYTDAGIEANQVAKLAKMQTDIFTKFGARMGNSIGSVLQPLQQQTQENAATQTFSELRFSDPRLQNDEVAQATWDKVQKMIGAGQSPSAEVIVNLGKIAYADLLEKDPNAHQQQQQAPPPKPPLNTQTRHTFPGAGHHTILPQRQQQTEQLDSDTQAAIAATGQLWVDQGFRVPGLKTNGSNKQVVTRGSV